VFLGRLSEKEKHARLKAADVLCAPSLGGESFGIVLIEGLAARCTVVASDIDGYSQALSGHGLLVKPGSVAALSQGLRAALAGEGPDSEEGFSYAASWSIASLADAYEHAYDLARSKYSRRFNA
jgi:phosphatidylinositol alpha-mannosyltransferase